jgi:hypothetical protein
MKRRSAAKDKDVAEAGEIRDLIERVRQQVMEGASKPSVGDYIRLLQIYRELEAETPKEIRVEWVDKSPGE